MTCVDSTTTCDSLVTVVLLSIVTGLLVTLVVTCFLHHITAIFDELGRKHVTLLGFRFFFKVDKNKLCFRGRSQSDCHML